MKKKTIGLLMLLMSFGLMWGMTGQRAQAAKKANVKVTLKNGVMTISGKGAMPKNFKVKNKKKVKKVVIKKGITTVSDGAFQGCKQLKKVSIPSTVKKIGCYSFHGTSIKKVTVPKSVKIIGQSAFRCRGEMEKLTLPGSFKMLSLKGDDAEYTIGALIDTVEFSSPLQLQTVSMFNAKNYIVNSKDSNYKSINGVIYSKDGKDIVRVPFRRKELVIEDGCEEFCLQSVLYSTLDNEGDPVYSCSLEKIVIPAGIKKIESKKYQAGKVAMPDRILSFDIRTKSLSDESVSELVSALNANPQELIHQLPEQITFENGLYITKDGILLSYTGEETEVTIPSYVRKIGFGAFQSHRSLKEVRLPNGLTEIGERAFANCGLSKIIFPKTVTSFGKECFSENPIGAVAIPDTIREIPRGMFRECTQLNWVKIPDSVHIIDKEAFYGCASLKGVEFGENIREVRAYAFGNIDMDKVVFHGSGKGISDHAFSCQGPEMSFTKSPNEMKTMFAIPYSQKGKKVKVELAWNPVTEASGYQVVIASNSKYTKNKKTLTFKKSKKNAKVTLSWKNKKPQGIFAKIRPFRYVNGNKIYGRWTEDSVVF